MKEVKQINETSIEVDGVIYEKKAEPQPEFRVGDWVIGVNAYPITPARIINVKQNNHLSLNNYSGYCHDDVIWCGKDRVFIRLATKEEIKSYLKEEAKRRGYYEAKRVKPLWEVNVPYWSIDSNSNYIRYESDSLFFSSCIYTNGKWAEIIPEKKKLPRTKGELISLLHTYDLRPKDQLITFFLADYEDTI